MVFRNQDIIKVLEHKEDRQKEALLWSSNHIVTQKEVLPLSHIKYHIRNKECLKISDVLCFQCQITLFIQFLPQTNNISITRSKNYTPLHIYDMANIKLLTRIVL
jgi:hypothetical protein